MTLKEFLSKYVPKPLPSQKQREFVTQPIDNLKFLTFCKFNVFSSTNIPLLETDDEVSINELLKDIAAYLKSGEFIYITRPFRRTLKCIKI